MLSKPTANSWSESNSASLHQTQGASLRIAIVTWIERTYHPRRRRRQKRLHGLTPVEYEAIMNTDVTRAA